MVVVAVQVGRTRPGYRSEKNARNRSPFRWAAKSAHSSRA
ncbi:MAG: hypothetical protein JWO31_1056, partial [Phycisphaerales bacterium]|nr:hypothetical protein [Phycisphaerales bacterium]